jgi:hypothetical protein
MAVKPAEENRQVNMMRGLMRISAAILVLSAAAAGPSTTLAAEPNYAPGSRVGLVTLPGLSPAKSFSGFEDTEKGVKVVAIEMPESAFGAIEASIGQKNPPPGMKKPERFETALGPAYLTRESAPLNGENVEQFAMIAKAGRVAALVTVQVPASAAGSYSADAVKQMLASLSMRAEVPLKEQLALLPFNLNDLAGFKTVRTLAPGQSVLLSDGDADTAIDNTTSMVIAVSRGGPAPTEDRGRFARQLMETLPGLKSGRVTASEPMRIGGGQGYETRMDAVLAKGDVEITVVQWLRFGSGGFIRMVGTAPKDDWSKVFPRLRAVRDGIDLK